ncbi:MAG: alpha/beta fold hydrolase [Pseudomonadota bacterium]
MIHPTRKCASTLLLLCTALFLCSCSLLEIRDQTETVEKTITFKGSVDVAIDTDARVYAALLYVDAGTARWVGEFGIGRSGRFQFYALPGDYAIAAFADENGDKIYQFEEPATYAADADGKPRIFTVGGGEKIKLDPIVLEGPLDNVSQYNVVPELSKATQNIGVQATLDDAIFSDDYAAMGMWRPLDFLGEVGGGLFMLQPFSPDKTPVIFVHGINGDPRNFREVVAGLDTERFQPWVFYYPSGVRLNMASDFLVKAVNQLEVQHGFDHFFVVAHSMGGLMARSFVKGYYESDHTADLAFFMTINSPIGGLGSARQGVEHSPIVVPAWRDLATGSDFIQEMEQWQWPDETPYHLVFSYQDGDASDGLVALESQLPRYLQQQAIRLYGYNAGHASILREPQFVSDLNEILIGGLDALGR